MSDEKVTITLGGLTASDAVNINAPVVINDIFDTYGEMTAAAGTMEAGETSFVRNINNESGTVSYPERGAFYVYDGHGFSLIVIGSHVHTNQAMLDEMGAIDVSALNTGDERVLTLVKTDTDNTQATPEYTLSWTSPNGESIPPAPAFADPTKRSYLTASSSGAVSWDSKILPIQTSRSISLIVSDAFLDRASLGKMLRIPDAYRKANGISYNPDNDEAFVFDDGTLLYQAALTVESCACGADAVAPDSGYNILVTLLDKDLSHIFSVGESIRILILRRGLAGALNTINDQYVTKSELASYATNGQVSLDGYATKDYIATMLRKYSKLDHVHDNYLLKTDYDAFDWRYAPYFHSHPEYVTHVEFAQALLGQTTVTPTDVATEFAALSNMLETRIDDKIEALTTVWSTNTNASSFIVDYSGQSSTLSGALAAMKNDIATIDMSLISSDAKISNLSAPVVTQLGGADPRNGTVSVQNGDTIEAVFRKLLRTAIRPTFTDPTFTLSRVMDSDADDIDGHTVSIKVKAQYTQNDAGTIASASAGIYDKTGQTLIQTLQAGDFVNGAYTFVFSQLPLIATDGTGICYVVKASVAINSDGMTKYYNTDEQHLNPIKSAISQLSAELAIGSVPTYYYGAIPDVLSDSDAEFTQKMTNALSQLTSDKLEGITEKTITVPFCYSGKGTSSEIRNRTLIFAQPHDATKHFTGIRPLSQNYEMMAEDYGTAVPSYLLRYAANIDTRATTSGQYDGYDFYWLTLPRTMHSDMTFRVSLG